jgi:hypothetical protein
MHKSNANSAGGPDASGRNLTVASSRAEASAQNNESSPSRSPSRSKTKKTPFGSSTLGRSYSTLNRLILNDILLSPSSSSSSSSAVAASSQPSSSSKDDKNLLKVPNANSSGLNRSSSFFKSSSMLFGSSKSRQALAPSPAPSQRMPLSTAQSTTLKATESLKLKGSPSPSQSPQLKKKELEGNELKSYENLLQKTKIDLQKRNKELKDKQQEQPKSTLTVPLPGSPSSRDKGTTDSQSLPSKAYNKLAHAFSPLDFLAPAADYSLEPLMKRHSIGSLIKVCKASTPANENLNSILIAICHVNYRLPFYLSIYYIYD